MSQEIIDLLSTIPGFYEYFIAFILVLARMLGFVKSAPVFSRKKDIVPIAKVGIALMLTFIILPLIEIGEMPTEHPLIILVIINLGIGLFFGTLANFIFLTVRAAGDFANNQMSLSSASMFDQQTGVQSSIVGQMLGMVGLALFIILGGLHWLILAIYRTFEVFPLYGLDLNLQEVVPLDYWVHISGNIIFLGFQLIAPVIITTMAIDLILGIISKTAPQVNVFQLSFVFKPCIGCIVLLTILPLLLRVMEDYFIKYAYFY